MINFFVHLKMSVGFNVKPKLNWINRFKKGNNRLVQSLYSRLSTDRQNQNPICYVPLLFLLENLL